MGKKFSFFDWASGKASARSKQKGSDLRKLVILAVSLITVVGLIIGIRRVFWSGGDHAHDKGPHGGIIAAIHQDCSALAHDHHCITLVHRLQAIVAPFASASFAISWR